MEVRQVGKVGECADEVVGEIEVVEDTEVGEALAKVLHRT